MSIRTGFFALIALLAPPAAAQLTVASTSPARHFLTAAPNTSIELNFDRALDPTTVPPTASGAVRVFGAYSGAMSGTFTLTNGNTTLRFDPARTFFAGERVIVGVRDTLKGADASSIQAGGYAYQFYVKAEPAPATFTLIDTISLRDVPTTSVRVYGGSANDYNDDDYIDIACINEDANDFRILLNRANGTGLFHPFLTPVNPVGNVPSPNESADMNGDGKTDIVTCNVNGSSVSVALGNGDGTFQPAATYPMGSAPHGIAVLDADGDGDQDVVTANTSSNNCSIRLNNGSGVLGAATNFEGGGSNEYGLNAADMNNDGMFDIVVGAISSQTVIVHLSNGNGTFTMQPPVNCGGNVWMLLCGELNGDGNMDVTVANSGSANGARLLGNGTGGLGAAATVPMLAQAIATDLGDIDGDGDIDWVLSDFGGGTFRLFKNDGAGVMTFDQDFPAPSNASCCGFVDIDNDRDLDLTMFDEISDVVELRRNGPAFHETFCYGDGSATACPCGNVGETGHGCDNSFATGGGLIASSGNADVSSDTLRLNATNLTPIGIAVFFQGTSVDSGGLGSFSGDGLRCAGGTLTRLGTRQGSNGMVSFGFGIPGDAPIHIGGSVPVGGATRYYQVAYRNVQTFCTPSTFNESNGVAITWVP